jgi:hypothetical protein
MIHVLYVVNLALNCFALSRMNFFGRNNNSIGRGKNKPLNVRLVPFFFFFFFAPFAADNICM